MLCHIWKKCNGYLDIINAEYQLLACMQLFLCGSSIKAALLQCSLSWSWFNGYFVLTCKSMIILLAFFFIVWDLIYFKSSSVKGLFFIRKNSINEQMILLFFFLELCILHSSCIYLFVFRTELVRKRNVDYQIKVGKTTSQRMAWYADVLGWCMQVM